jgi:Mg/Co/Ni transporter MgtE
MNFRRVGTALLKESATALLMAVICGAVLGAIGAFWANHVIFGAVIGGALTCSMLTAGFMGTMRCPESRGWDRRVREFCSANGIVYRASRC